MNERRSFPPCPKCGEPDPIIEWKPAIPRTTRDMYNCVKCREMDHFHVFCRRCDYVWISYDGA